MVVALVALFVVLSGAALGATGDKWILGKSNSADQTTSLSSTASGAALKITNTNTGLGIYGSSAASVGVSGETQAANVAAVSGLHDGAQTGTGISGFATNGYGVVGDGTTAGGSFVGISSGDGVQAHTSASGKSGVYAHHDSNSVGYGVYATSDNGDGVFASAGTTGDGVEARATASGKSGVWAHHNGNNFGYGLFAQSSTGPAIGLKSNTNAPPITLDGNPFPAATAGFKAGVSLPDDSELNHVVATLTGIAPGTYVVIAKLQVSMDSSGHLVTCELHAGSDSDLAATRGDVDAASLTTMVFHTFAGGGSAQVICGAAGTSAMVDVKIAAIEVAGGTNTALP